MSNWLLFSVVAMLFAYLGVPGKVSPKYTKLFHVLLSIWLAWFVSFGGGAMQDQTNYMNSYNASAKSQLFGLGEMIKSHYIALTGVRSGTEIGYVFLNILFNKLGFSFIGFSFFFSIVINIFMASFIYRYKYPVLIVLVFITTSYYSQQANLVRQMMAASIFLYSTKYILERKIFKYFTAILIASLFHASSIILLPVYFIVNKNYPLFILLTIWAFSILMNLFSDQFGFIKIMQSWSVNYYDMYLNKDEGVGLDTGIDLKLNVFLFVFLAFKSHKLNKDMSYLMVLNIFFIGVVILNFRIVSDWFFRVSLYFVIVYIILIPSIVNYLAHSIARKYINFRIIGRYLVLLIIVYHSYLLFSYTFRPDATGITLGTKMYSFSEMFKNLPD